MKRKTLMSVIGFIGAILLFLKEQFGLAIDASGFATALGVILAYVFFEAKRDIETVYQQASRLRDPKFWLSFIAVALTALNESFGLSLPVDAINVVLGIIVSILFKLKVATT